MRVSRLVLRNRTFCIAALLAVIVAAAALALATQDADAASRRDSSSEARDRTIGPRVGIQAAPGAAPFTRIANLGDPAPGGGTFAAGVDFEPYAINSSGKLGFAADMSTGGEGVFTGRAGALTQVARSGLPAPGGGTFGGFGVFGNVGLNENGDVAFSFGLEPFALPIGLGAGVYRRSAATGTLQAAVVPGVTLAPDGAPFQGAGFRATLNSVGDIAFAGMVQTSAGIEGPLGIGIFRASPSGAISDVASPGDPAPGGGSFDFAQN